MLGNSIGNVDFPPKSRTWKPEERNCRNWTRTECGWGSGPWTEPMVAMVWSNYKKIQELSLQYCTRTQIFGLVEDYSHQFVALVFIHPFETLKASVGGEYGSPTLFELKMTKMTLICDVLDAILMPNYIIIDSVIWIVSNVRERLNKAGIGASCCNIISSFCGEDAIASSEF